MTEPIIINGVDVSECEYYDSKMNGVCECKNTKEYGTPTRVTGCGGCKFNPNCYYKQLKRKERELQEAMDNYVQATNYYEDKLAQIKRIINEVENESK